MSGLTPEAALRVSAEHLSKMHGASDMVLTLIAEADRLEAASELRRRSRVANAAVAGAIMNEQAWTTIYNAVEADVLAHHVGPGRVVVDREDLATGLHYLENHGATGPAVRNLREALS